MTALELTRRLGREGGAIVSSNDCSAVEIAFARANDRFFVDEDGFGYVLRYRDWLDLAMRLVAAHVTHEEGQAMTTPDLLRKVAEAVRTECIRICTEIGERAQMRRLDLDAIIQRVLADHAEVLDAPDADGPWLARLGERAWDGKGPRWQAVLVCGFGDQMFVLVPGGGLPWPLGDFDRWQRIVPAC